MIDEGSRMQLVNHRVEQAKSTATEAEILLANNMLRGAMNRMYYSMFYMLQALSLKFQFESSKHSQLLGWFNKTFIHTGKIDIRFSKILTKGYNFRTKGDYATVYDFDKLELIEMYREMMEFIEEIERFLREDQRQSP